MSAPEDHYGPEDLCEELVGCHSGLGNWMDSTTGGAALYKGVSQQPAPGVQYQYAPNLLPNRQPQQTMPEAVTRFSEYQHLLRDSGDEVTNIVIEKNLAYGNAIRKVCDIMTILFPEGIRPDQYEDVLLLVRDLDKTCRIADGDKAAFGENPWRDKAGYALCGVANGKATEDAG